MKPLQKVQVDEDHYQLVRSPYKSDFMLAAGVFSLGWGILLVIIGLFWMAAGDAWGWWLAGGFIFSAIGTVILGEQESKPPKPSGWMR